MCTAISENYKYHLFGRTLDLEYSYQENAVCVPRNFRFDFLYQQVKRRHAAIIGIAHLHGGVPLFYDAVNEHGLAAAALNFPKLAAYSRSKNDGTDLASFELIPWLLCECENLKSAVEKLKKINITDDSIDPSLPSTPLHWLIADKTGSVVVEPQKSGIKLYKNPFGVLTNAPEFTYHVNRLSDFMSASPTPPENRIFPQSSLSAYSRGMGAFGLPGDLSSSSRFVRAVFAKAHTAHGDSKSEEISRFFHVMSTVNQPSGCVLTEKGDPVRTVYTSCADTETGTYYFTTYACRRLCSVSLKNTELDSDTLTAYPMTRKEDILPLDTKEV